MLSQNPGHRPAIATFFGLVSLLWALITLGWVLIVVPFAILIGAGSWLAGPAIGVFGMAVGLIIVLYCLVSSSMSFLLLWAGWQILRGSPSGISLLRMWAWTSLIFDTLTLLLSVGTAPVSWGALLYAIAALYFTRPVALVDAWAVPGGPNLYNAKPPFQGDADF